MNWATAFSIFFAALSASAAAVSGYYAYQQVTLARQSERQQALGLVWDASKATCLSVIPDEIRSHFIYLSDRDEVATSSNKAKQMALNEVAASIASNSAGDLADKEFQELATRYVASLSPRDANSFGDAYDALQLGRKNALEAMKPEQESARSTNNSAKWVQTLYRFQNRCLDEHLKFVLATSNAAE